MYNPSMRKQSHTIETESWIVGWALDDKKKAHKERLALVPKK